MKAVKVVGLGAACANGLTKEDFFESVATGQTSIDDSGLSSLSENQWLQLSEKTPQALRISKCTVLAHSSLQEALRDSGWSPAEIAESGFILASTTSQIDQWEKHLPFYLHSDSDQDRIRRSVTHQSLGAPALSLTKSFGIHGPLAFITSSCSASLQALAMAFYQLRQNKVRRCIVGAVEIHTELTRVGFGSLRLLSKSNCRPFDKNRSGINLGEASAFLCLELDDLRNDVPNWGFLAGAGLSTDAYHATSPHPEGKGSQTAMKMALDSALLSPAQIDWIYAHGTGSPANDLAETKAILKLFGHEPCVTSTKSSHGHTLAASGALESVLGMMAMQRNQILPTYNYQAPDPQIPLRVSALAQERRIEHFLKNSLGFGGINASVIFSKTAGQR